MHRGGKVASYAFYGTCAHGTKLWAATLDMIIEQIMTIHDKKKTRKDIKAYDAAMPEYEAYPMWNIV
jgi:hypothetical protein